ncbi:MAG: 30S ribosomal protein S11 [Armatimonadetes bacterium]|nr:30S ribosomal protein S11 [Armatimonadota bacterium]MDW8121185.1 30S ribosomal protein S11 [Armatimonadota bacterium]
MAQKKAAKKGPRRRRERRVVTHGVAHIHATYNNTIITITDPQGNTLTYASGGTVGLKGTKKGTPFAAQLAAQAAGRRAMDMGMRHIDIVVKGAGVGRDTAVRALQAVGLEIGSIRDITPTPHNGCRPSRRRRT